MNTIQPSASLREVSGLTNHPPALRDSVLLMIDFQNTYRTGVMALAGAGEALSAGAQLLAQARRAGTPVVHIINDGGAGTPYDIGAHIGAISPEVAPIAGEPVVIKQYPNAFHETELTQTLTAHGAGPGSNRDLILAGFMTHMCVSYTAEGAFNLGYRPTVVANATATRALSTPSGGLLPAATLQAAALTTIADLFGIVVPSAASLAS